MVVAKTVLMVIPMGSQPTVQVSVPNFATLLGTLDLQQNQVLEFAHVNLEYWARQAGPMILRLMHLPATSSTRPSADTVSF